MALNAKIYEIPEISSPVSEGMPELLQSKYTFNSHIFPNDLGMSDNSHYVIFNINIQTKLFSDTVAGNFGHLVDTDVTPKRSKVDQLRFGDNIIIPLPGEVLVGVPRTTRRIAESIALHMPTPLVFNTHNIYEEISLTALGAKLGVATIAGVKRFLPQSIAKAVSTVVNAVGQVISGGTKLAQAPINPMVEILFATTVPRQFTFEVLMAPRNSKESESIKKIIKAFRFHGAPEVGAMKGLLWSPPAEFDITFFNKGVENTNILRITTCALERIEVDYAPTSGIYSTFRNGHPVAVRLSLGFRELEPIHKKRVIQGF